MNYIYITNKRVTNKIKKLYEEYQILDCHSNKRFLAKINNTTIKIFSDKKVMLLDDISEFQKIAFIEQKYNKRNIIKEKNSYFEKKKQLINKRIKETTKYNEISTIGIDETGVSEYMYPLVVAAIYVPKSKIQLLKDLGVKDSKKLNKTEIMNIDKELTKLFMFNTQILTNKEYNQKYDNNYIKIRVDMCNKSINSILDSSVKHTIIDAFTNQKNFFSYYSNRNIINKIFLIEKADEYILSVSAASIIAKYTLYLELSKLEEKYNVSIPSNQKAMLVLTKKLVKIHGETIINELCKKNYIHTKKILQEIEDEKF